MFKPSDFFILLAVGVSFAVWGVLVYVLVPGVAPRYLIPILPFVSILVAGSIVGTREREGSAAAAAEPAAPAPPPAPGPGPAAAARRR